MAPSRTPGPVGLVAEVAADLMVTPISVLAGAWGCTEPETDKDKPRVGGCHPHLPSPLGCTVESAINLRPIKSLEVHIYMDIGEAREDYFQWLTNADLLDEENRSPLWKFNPTRHFDPSVGIKSFADSLSKTGAVVLYLGHSDLGPTGDGPSRGLVPFERQHSKFDPPQIPSEKLRQMLEDSKASLVILASCDSVTAVGKLKKGPPVVVVDSGKKRVSHGGPMALAAGAFLLSLSGVALDRRSGPHGAFYSGHANIREALEAANETFAETRDGSAFVLAGGQDCVQLIP